MCTLSLCMVCACLGATTPALEPVPEATSQLEEQSAVDSEVEALPQRAEQTAESQAVVPLGDGATLTWLWTGAEPGDGAFRWSISSRGATTSFDVDIDLSDPFNPTWQGTRDGVPANGDIFFVEGDSGTAVFVMDSEGDVIAAFELDAGGLPGIGVMPPTGWDEVGRPANTKCVCWPPQGASCTNDECYNSDDCGTGGVCMMRNLRGIESGPLP